LGLLPVALLPVEVALLLSELPQVALLPVELSQLEVLPLRCPLPVEW
jgi:hypothetical protein